MNFIHDFNSVPQKHYEKQLEIAKMHMEGTEDKKDEKDKKGENLTIVDSWQVTIDSSLPVKRVVNGKLVIEKNGQLFNANGQHVK